MRGGGIYAILWAAIVALAFGGSGFGSGMCAIAAGCWGYCLAKAER